MINRICFQAMNTDFYKTRLLSISIDFKYISFIPFFFFELPFDFGQNKFCISCYFFVYQFYLNAETFINWPFLTCTQVLRLNDVNGGQFLTLVQMRTFFFFFLSKEMPERKHIFQQFNVGIQCSVYFEIISSSLEPTTEVCLAILGFVPKLRFVHRLLCKSNA